MTQLRRKIQRIKDNIFKKPIQLNLLNIYQIKHKGSFDQGWKRCLNWDTNWISYICGNSSYCSFSFKFCKKKSKNLEAKITNIVASDGFTTQLGPMFPLNCHESEQTHKLPDRTLGPLWETSDVRTVVMSASPPSKLNGLLKESN